jgi:hypothetical protein
MSHGEHLEENMMERRKGRKHIAWRLVAPCMRTRARDLPTMLSDSPLSCARGMAKAMLRETSPSFLSDPERNGALNMLWRAGLRVFVTERSLFNI